MTLNLALIGAGAIAHEHLAAYQKIPGVTIGAVIDRDPTRARSLATIAGGVPWGTDATVPFADPAITAVDICTPPDTHAALTIAAAEHGKPIHLEKPAALSLAEFDAMVVAATRANVPLVVGQTTRFQPVHQETVAAIATGAIGRPRFLHLTRYAGHVWPGGWDAWQLDPIRCGGHPVHNGVHVIDIAVWLMDAAPARVFARGFRSFAPTMTTPDSFHVTIRFADDSLALLEWSYALRTRGEILGRIVVTGETGSIHHTTESEPNLDSDAARLVSPALAGAFDAQLRHWIAVLRGEEAPIVRHDQVRHALAAALAAQESIETGRAIELEEAPDA